MEVYYGRRTDVGASLAITGYTSIVRIGSNF